MSNPPPSTTTSSDAVTGSLLSSSGLIPDVLSLTHSSSTSLALLPVTFPHSSTAAHLGNTLTPTLTTPPPTFTLPPHLSPTAFYTLLCLDPDAPSRRRPRMRSILHLLTTNIPGSSPTLQGGAEVCDWVPPGPPSSGGLHRYVFLLYEQVGGGAVDVGQLPSFGGMTGRGKQTEEGLLAMLDKAGGGKLELRAVNWFEAAYDEQVMVNMRAKMGWMAGLVHWVVNMLT